MTAVRVLANDAGTPDEQGDAIGSHGAYEATLRGPRLLRRPELDLNEHLVRIVDVPEQPVAGGGAARARSVVVEQRLPGVVVADVDAGDDERHLTYLPN